MPTDADILRMINEAFAGCRRPDHFTDYTHCEECADYDDLLRSRSVETLQIENVGNPGWDPICFISSEGFTYYFPALARLALAQPDYGRGWYGAQLLFHLNGDGKKNRRFLACTREQRRAVVKLLQHLIETRAALADTERSTDELFQALEIWSEENPVA